jgi:hypothetical protein
MIPHGSRLITEYWPIPRNGIAITDKYEPAKVVSSSPNQDWLRYVDIGRVS